MSELKAAYVRFQFETDDVVAKGLGAKQVFSRMVRLKCIKQIRGQAKVVWWKRETKGVVVPRSPGSVLVDQKTDISHVFAVLPSSLVQCIRELVPDFVSTLHSIVIETGQPVTLFQGDRRPPIRVDLHDVDLRAICDKVGNSLKTFGFAAIGESLHTCRAKVDAAKDVITGVTIRVARIVQGRSDVEDLVKSRENIVVLGCGKTTFLRDMVALLSAQSSVMVIDTRGELGGLGSITHPSLGHVRRVVPRKGAQASAIREAITCHAVKVVVVDELCGLEEFGILEEARVRNVRFIVGCPRELEFALTASVFDVAVEVVSSACCRVHDLGNGTHQVGDVKK